MPSIAEIMAMAQAAGSGIQTIHTVMIVDDDAAARALLRTTLGKAKKNVKFVEASDGSEAIDYLSTTEKLPALLITDIMMPNMNGKQAITRVRRKHSKEKLPIVVCTATNHKTMIVELLQLGVNDVIIKPIDIPTIASRIFRHLPPDEPK